jgi:hypothetical protein
MPGILVIDGGDLRLSDIRIEFGPDGLTPSSPKVDLRIDMWRHWLAEAVSAAIEAAEIAPVISAELLESDTQAACRLMIDELRASMRAITSAAFAIDAFYASVKARSPEHPQQAAWDEKPQAGRQHPSASPAGHEERPGQGAGQTSQGIVQVPRLGSAPGQSV